MPEGRVRPIGEPDRYDTPTELTVLNELWPSVNDRLNFYMPTKKPIGWSSDPSDPSGRCKRVYDTPKTPYHRLLDSRILSRAQQRELAAYKASLDPLFSGGTCVFPRSLKMIQW
ncbi:hypothetical protein CITRIK5_70162 [Citricoccus sp. K5]|nr:hypothetical protein CITRIK5_70162 [Citricoccus sp. K5]